MVGGWVCRWVGTALVCELFDGFVDWCVDLLLSYHKHHPSPMLGDADQLKHLARLVDGRERVSGTYSQSFHHARGRKEGLSVVEWEVVRLAYLLRHHLHTHRHAAWGCYVGRLSSFKKKKMMNASPSCLLRFQELCPRFQRITNQ